MISIVNYLFENKEHSDLLSKINDHPDFEDLRKAMKKTAAEQAKHWPDKNSGNDNFEKFHIHSITPGKGTIMIHGDGWMKDGHSSSVSADYNLKTKKFSVEKQGING